MPKSMTGFGRARRQSASMDVMVEIKAVNSRYFEFTSRIPRAYGYVEEKLKSLLCGKISRGKVEAALSVTPRNGQDAAVKINMELARGYLGALRSLGEELKLADNLNLAAVSRLPDIFLMSKTDEDEEAVWDEVRAAAEEALERFMAMRQAEGERLTADLTARLAVIAECVTRVETASPPMIVAYRERMTAKIKEILAGKTMDEGRILTEVAIYADRMAVDEETVRLRSHLSQFEGILRQDEPVGRRLDFLVQEMNREVNTIGSKCQDLSLTKIVLDMKAEIEKIREQIQNLE